MKLGRKAFDWVSEAKIVAASAGRSSLIGKSDEIKECQKRLRALWEDRPTSKGAGQIISLVFHKYKLPIKT